LNIDRQGMSVLGIGLNDPMTELVAHKNELIKRNIIVRPVNWNPGPSEY
jgi:hypothetical protein